MGTPATERRKRERKKQRERELRSEYFPHFSLRLSERYGILITFEEYNDLCIVPAIELKKRYTPLRTSTVNVMKIKGREVLVVKWGNVLVTALPHKNRLNYPKYIKLKNSGRRNTIGEDE